MRFFAQLEAACANAVERAFATAFPTALEPVHVARKLVATFESGSSSATRAGRRFVVRMSAGDHARLAADLPYLEPQWATMLGRLAERSGVPQRAPEVRAEGGADIAAGTVAIVVETLEEPLALALRVRRGMPNGATVPLGRTVVVGRDPGCDLVLHDPRVSRQHVEVAHVDGTLGLRDLGSSNGTRLNGLPVTHAELALGDVVSLGESELLVEAAGEPA